MGSHDDGSTADVIVASPSFAPQVAKILAPLPYLTVAQVALALAAGVSSPTRTVAPGALR